MGDSFGRAFRITTWGESHGGGVGVVIDGCPAGLELDEQDIQHELAVRYRALPIGRLGSILVLATPHIDERRALALRTQWGGKVILVLASRDEVQEALRAHYPAAYASASAVPAMRAGDLEPQTLLPAKDRSGDLPAWWKAAIVGEGPVVPPEAPELE